MNLLRGDCLALLPTLADDSVDSIVTDPPYELGFMGKSWDNSGIAYNVDLWRECLRVLKPGGHLLAFGGSRTYHRLACAVEDAGFEIRDQIMWLYGSGFPKSLDVSKAIDKGTGENLKRQLRFTEWMRSTGITAKQIDEATETNMGGHYLTEKIQPAIATANLFDKLRHLLPEVPEEIERLVAERTGIEWTAYKNREVVGTKFSGIANKEEGQRHTIGASKAVEVDITAPATPDARRWQGWGTALKPAHEPIVVARKPFVGTVASNVLEWGTGALNVDGCRIPIGDEYDPALMQRQNSTTAHMGGLGSKGSRSDHVQPMYNAERRWPANVIHDGSDEVVTGFPASDDGVAGKRNDNGSMFNFGVHDEWGGYGGSGSAARFFYCAKADRAERDAGLAHLVEGDSPRANTHPTVKPLDLMRYLVRLVTPPNGVVLDPFLGSGTTACAAILEGFEWVGCEMTEDYWPIIEARVRWANEQGHHARLFT